MYFKGSFVRINRSHLNVHEEYITAGLGPGLGLELGKLKFILKNKF